MDLAIIAELLFGGLGLFDQQRLDNESRAANEERWQEALKMGTGMRNAENDRISDFTGQMSRGWEDYQNLARNNATQAKSEFNDMMWGGNSAPEMMGPSAGPTPGGSVSSYPSQVIRPPSPNRRDPSDPRSRLPDPTTALPSDAGGPASTGGFNPDTPAGYDEIIDILFNTPAQGGEPLQPVDQPGRGGPGGIRTGEEAMDAPRAYRPGDEIPVANQPLRQNPLSPRREVPLRVGDPIPTNAVQPPPRPREDPTRREEPAPLPPHVLAAMQAALAGQPLDGIIAQHQASVAPGAAPAPAPAPAPPPPQPTTTAPPIISPLRRDYTDPRYRLDDSTTRSR